MQSRLLIFFISFYLVILPVSAALASEGGLAFNVTPMISDLTIDAGTSQTGIITVHNNAAIGTAPLRLKITMKDWTLNTAGEPQFMDSGTRPDSCGNWLQITPLELSIAPGESQLVRYTANVPADAQGAYHGVILMTTAPQPGTVNNVTINVSGCIAHTIYIQVGPAVRRAKITALTLTSSGVSVTVQNTGSSCVRVSGVVKIADSTGAVVQEIKIPKSLVLPGTDSTRIISANTLSPLSSGTYVLTSLLDYGGDALLGARINATLP